MPYALEESEDSEACLPITLRLDNDNLGENRTVAEFEPHPVDKARLVRHKHITGKLCHRQFLLLPLCEIK